MIDRHTNLFNAISRQSTVSQSASPDFSRLKRCKGKMRCLCAYPPCTRNVRNVLVIFLATGGGRLTALPLNAHRDGAARALRSAPSHARPMAPAQAVNGWRDGQLGPCLLKNPGREPLAKPQHRTPLPFLPLTTRRLRVQCNDPKQAVIPGAGLRFSRAPEAVRATQPKILP